MYGLYVLYILRIFGTQNLFNAMSANPKKGYPNNLTYLVFPFYFNEPLADMASGSASDSLIEKIDGIISNDKTLWVRKDATIDDNVLYEYIKPNINADTTPFLAYALRSFEGKEGEGNPLKAIRNKVWEKLEPVLSVPGQDKTYRVGFGRDRNNWNGPTLLVSPRSSVGMLVLSVNPVLANPTVYDIIDFNYHLHKIDGQQKLFMPSKLQELTNPKAIEARKELLNLMRTGLKVKDCNVNEEGLIFTLLDVMEMLLTGLPSMSLFEKGRVHVFTYYNFIQDSLTMTEDEKQAMILLTRCADNKYNIPVEHFDESLAYISTFSNIYMGSSIEGGCICTIEQGMDGPDANPANGFIRNFALGILQHRYLWLYFMALIQRYEMLHTVAGLSALDLHDGTAAQREDFKREYGNFCSTKIQSFFRNVSSFSQHNQFYKFLIDNMEVDELYREVENKMQIVDSYLQMRNNELQAQRNELLETRNEQNEKRNHRLNRLSLWLSVFFAVATFSQAAESLYHICTGTGWGQIYFGLGTLGVYAIAIILIYILVIKQNSR